MTTFWVDYRRGGTLAYRELLVALAVRHRRGVAATAVAAWVDEDQSLTGGRELWSIPKELGTFAFTPAPGHRDTALSLLTGTGRYEEAVHGRHRERLRLPGRMPVRARLVQATPGGGVCEVPLRLTGTVGLATARLTAGDASGLAFLNNHRPRLSLTLHDFRFTVGTPADCVSTLVGT